MPLIINEEQQMLKESARDFLKEKAPISQFRKLRDENDPLGYDPKLWAEMAEMGWAALTIPESYGGLDFGYTGLGQILEETGRTLTASPLVSTVLLCATAIEKGGNQVQKEAHLGPIASGERLMAFAHEESNFHQTKVSTTASPNADLTWQDWEQITAGRGWGRQGRWYVDVKEASTYEVEVIARDTLDAWKVRLEIGEQTWDAETDERTRRLTIPSVSLPQGPAIVMGYIDDGVDEVLGPYQLIFKERKMEDKN